MTQVELGSRSDLETLQRSGRGKIWVLAALLLAALGAAVFTFVRREGVGNPETPGKVLVVSFGTTRGYSVVLGDMGFEAVEGTLNAWVDKADEELEELEVTGVPAVMQLADKFGYGYVVFERPQEVDFSGLELDTGDVSTEDGKPVFPEHVRFAVLSAGDYGFPHRMTVNPEPSTVMRDNAVVLLQALFEQEKLAEVLPANENPSVEVLQLRDRLGEALHKLEQLPQAEKMARDIVEKLQVALEDEEKAEPKPWRIGDALETGQTVPLASGPVLTFSRGFELVTRDAVRASLDLADHQALSFGAVDAEPPSRQPCTSLLDGKMSVHDSPQYAVSPAGDAVLTKSLSDGRSLWALRGPECTFERLGEIPAPGPGIEAFGEPHVSGAVAREGSLDNAGFINVVRAGREEQASLGMLDAVVLDTPVWLTERHLAAIGRFTGYDPTGLRSTESIYLFDTDTPLKVLRIDAIVFGTDRGALSQITATAGERPRFAVSVGDKLHVFDLPATLPELFTTPAMAEGVTPVVREGFPSVYDLDPSRFTAKVVFDEGFAHDLVIARDGTRVAFSVFDQQLDAPESAGDDEIAVVSVDGAKMRLVTRNKLAERRPRFTADGKHLVFQTQIAIPKTEVTAWLARAAPVE